jgi:glyoxylase-like metal-dependent hydrolase (beta-lactamase superfamily II)
VLLAAAGLHATTTSAATAPATPAARPAAATANALAMRAAEALGGLQKIRAVRNITLNGYGQWAYQNGGGRITGDPDAPEKLIAANDLRRVYDLEHDRFQAQERRNNLFPFLLPNGHAYALLTQGLDGDVGFNVNAQGQANRVALLADGDGVHMRRMWMLNNPIALVRTLLDPATRLSAPRMEAGRWVVDATLKQGWKLSVGFQADGLPRFVRWAGPQTNLGEVVYTTVFTGYGDVGNGLMLPFGYRTRENWRDVDYFKLYVDAYQIDSAIPDLAAPAAVRSAPEPASYPRPTITPTPVAKGVWRLSNGTSVIEFKDHLVLFELGMNTRQAQAVIDAAKALAPGKPIRYLIASHNHFDHTAGLRLGMAEGATLIGRPVSGELFREMHDHPNVEFKDALALKPQPFRFRPVTERLRLQDETQTVDIYWGRQNAHMQDVIFAYLPEHKVMIEGDLVTAAYEWQHWPDTFRDVIAHYKLDVERVVPVHGVIPNHPTHIYTHAEAEEVLKGGTERARKNCADLQAKGVYHPGCPIQSKYY